MDEVIEVFKKLNLETEDERESFNYDMSDQDEEFNIDGLGLNICS